MLGELPQDFLRIQLVQAQVYDQAPYGMRQPGYVGGPQHQQQMYQNPNFLGYFTLTIAEVMSTGVVGCGNTRLSNRRSWSRVLACWACSRWIRTSAFASATFRTKRPLLQAVARTRNGKPRTACNTLPPTNFSAVHLSSI